MKDTAKNRAKIQEFVNTARAYTDEHGHPPTIVELAEMLNISVTTASSWMGTAVDWQLIDRDAKKKLLVDRIVDYMLDNGFPPTYAEIAEQLGVSGWVAGRLLRQAELDKLLELPHENGRISRGIRVPGVYYVDDRSPQ